MDTINTIQLSRGGDAGERNANFVPDDQRGTGNVLVRLWHSFCALDAKRRSRRALGELNAEQLDDIGLTKAEARREAAVPFWR
jgi:uncharacterized protein YjiS (DUF1127 family)